jgi:hypothetical protein
MPTHGRSHAGSHAAPDDAARAACPQNNQVRTSADAPVRASALWATYGSASYVRSPALRSDDAWMQNKGQMVLIRAKGATVR